MSPEEILQEVYRKAAANLESSAVADEVIREKVEYVCRCIGNRRWKGQLLHEQDATGRFQCSLLTPDTSRHSLVFDRVSIRALGGEVTDRVDSSFERYKYALAIHEAI
jgi:hypothetical protein